MRKVRVVAVSAGLVVALACTTSRNDRLRWRAHSIDPRPEARFKGSLATSPAAARDTTGNRGSSTEASGETTRASRRSTASPRDSRDRAGASTDLAADPGTRTGPDPTAIAEGRDASSLARRREAWLESLHRAGPGTDWREIEQKNRRRLLEEREERRAAQAAQAPGETAIVPSRGEAAILPAPGEAAITRAPAGAALASLGSPWTEIGSLNLAGRTHQAVFDESTSKLYVGSALGGVWRGDFEPGDPDPATLSWVPLSDDVYGGARGIVLFPGSPPTLVKTHSGFSSGEIHRSTDGGSTWSVVATLNGPIKRILKPFGSQTTIFVMALDCCATRSMLYRSTNAGASFHLLRTFNAYESDIWISRTGLSPLYLLAQNTLEVSVDDGDTWSVRGTLSLVTARRATLTGSEVGLPRLYAVAMTVTESTRRLLRSDDAGFTWVDKGAVPDFWSDHTSLSVSSRNANLVLYGGLECWRSTNGGTSFQKINAFGEYYANPAARLHSDITSIDFVPLEGGEEALFIGTSGGAYFSKDGGATVVNLSLQGLRVSQYFSTLSDAVDPTRIAAGSQDQGYQLGSSGTGQFLQRIAGDFGQLTSSDGTDTLVFSSHSSFVLGLEKVGAAYNIFTQGLPAGEDRSLLAPLAADPKSPNVVYLGAEHLHRYELADGTWTVTPLPFDFQGQPGEFVSAVAIAPSDPDRWYVATSLGRFFFSSDAGANWTASKFTSVPAPQDMTGLAIAVLPTNADVVAIGGSGYSNPAVYVSTDGGASFSPLGTGQPQTLVTGLSWGPAPAFDLYAGTESGPWRFRSSSESGWESVLGTDAPLTHYWSVERTGTRMRFGTFGRGIWDYSVCPAAPAGIPALTVTRSSGEALLAWTDVPGSMAYDVVRGSLGVLRSSGGDFASATTDCLANDALVRELSDATSPSAGGGFWYLVRPMNCAGSGTYDSGGSAQAGSRDPGIDASPAHCL